MGVSWGFEWICGGAGSSFRDISSSSKDQGPLPLGKIQKFGVLLRHVGPLLHLLEDWRTQRDPFLMKELIRGG